MATFGEIVDKVDSMNATLDEVATGLEIVASDVQELKDQLAAGSAVSQVQVDTLDAKVQEAKTQAEALRTAVDSITV